MKVPRSGNRRSFSVATAGYFTVLKPEKWFASWRSPGDPHNLHARIEAAAQAAVEGQSAPKNQTTIQLELKPEPEPHRPVRLALIVLAATAITLFLLWWLFVRPHPAI